MNVDEVNENETLELSDRAAVQDAHTVCSEIGTGIMNDMVIHDHSLILRAQINIGFVQF